MAEESGGERRRRRRRSSGAARADTYPITLPRFEKFSPSSCGVKSGADGGQADVGFDASARWGGAATEGSLRACEVTAWAIRWNWENSTGLRGCSASRLQMVSATGPLVSKPARSRAVRTCGVHRDGVWNVGGTRVA